MKKPTFWAGIIGGLTVANSIYQGAEFFAHPTDITIVNVSIWVSNALWLCFGVFLITLYLRGKQKEDAGHIPLKFTPDSPEDIEFLKIRRNWILGFVLLISIIFSVGPWVLNNFAAGLTLVNAFVIFDSVFNIAFFFVVISLFRNKQSVLNPLFYAVTIYGVVEAAMDMPMHLWFGATVNVLLVFYFAYAIKTPINRKNHRITHLVILPALVILILSSPYFDNGNIPQLLKNDQLFEQQYLNANGSLNSSYQLFLEKQTPDLTDIQAVLDAKADRDKTIQEVISNLNTLQAEYKRQLPSVSQQESIEQIVYTIAVFSVYKEQGDKVQDLMNYVKGLDLNNLSAMQKSNIGVQEKEIYSYNAQLTDLQFKESGANLNNI